MNRMNIMLPGHRAYEVCYSMQLCRGVCESCSHSGDWDRQERTLPSVRAGVSFVIPSFARPHNLYTLLPGLLRHRTMQHPESEIIISHASTRSWRERLSLDNSTQTACAPKACASNAVGKPSHRLCGECAPQPWRLRHLDHTLQNRKFLTALRFVAAADASTPPPCARPCAGSASPTWIPSCPLGCVALSPRGPLPLPQPPAPPPAPAPSPLPTLSATAPTRDPAPTASPAVSPATAAAPLLRESVLPSAPSIPSPHVSPALIKSPSVAGGESAASFHAPAR